MVSDVLWTEGGGTRPARLWVWVQGGPKAGLWVRADGEDDFKRIDTPGFAKKRGVLAAATPPDTVYVLNDRHHKDAAQAQLPAMFRVSAAGNATPTASRVSVVPDVLGRQGFYDMAIAVDPSDATRVVIAGSTFDTTTPGGTAVSGDGGILAGEVGTTGTGLLMFGPTTSPDMIGIGVHADVHDLAFSNDGNRLWTSCDGGVYRSDDPAAIAGFRAVQRRAVDHRVQLRRVAPDVRGLRRDRPAGQRDHRAGVHGRVAPHGRRRRRRRRLRPVAAGPLRPPVPQRQLGGRPTAAPTTRR